MPPPTEVKQTFFDLTPEQFGALVVDKALALAELAKTKTVLQARYALTGMVVMSEQGIGLDLASEIRLAMGRGREHMTTLSVRLPIHMHDEVRKLCRDLEVQQNELIVYLLKPVLPRMREELRLRKSKQRELDY